MSTEHLVGEVGAVLDALMGMEAEPREKAEKYLSQLTLQDPGQILLVLAQIGIGVGGYQSDHRLLSLILLRRMAFRPLAELFLNSQARVPSCPFDVVAERTRGRIEEVLCAGLRDEVNVRMRKGLGSCAAGWAQESAKRQRPCLPLPPVMLELVASREPFKRFTPFQLLTLCPTLLVDSVREPIPTEQLAQLLVAGLNDPSVDVRVEAIKAVQSAMQEGLTLQERSQIGGQLVYEAFNAVTRLPTTTIEHGLLPFLDLTQRYCKLVMPYRAKILPVMLELLSPPASCLPSDVPFTQYKSYSDDYTSWFEIANPASEIIMTLVEAYPDEIVAWEDGRIMRELPSLMMGWVVAGLATDGEDCEDWLNASSLYEVDEDYPLYPEEALARLGQVTTTGALLHSLMQSIPQLLHHSDWRCRYAALTSLAGVCDSQREAIIPSLKSFLESTLPFSKDPHPRVRYAFLHTLGLLFSCGKDIDVHTSLVLPVIIHLLQDPQPRVRGAACGCLEYYFELETPVSSWMPYIEEIASTILRTFNLGPLSVQEKLMGTLNVIAPYIANDFEPFYRVYMALAIELIDTHKEPAHRELVGAAAGCAVGMALAVGKERFSKDAVNLARVMITCQNNIVDSDDPRSKAFLDAWVNFCRALGEDFEPFLPHVLPPLLKAASYKPKKSHSSRPKGLTEEDDQEDEYSGDDSTEAQSAEMQEKIVAFDNIGDYARELKGKFKPYVQTVMALALDALTFAYSSDIREIAPHLIPMMLQCAKDSGDPSLINLDHTFTAMLEALSQAEYYTEISLILTGFIDSLTIIGTSLPSSLVQIVIKAVEGILVDLGSQREVRVLQQDWMDDIQRVEEEEVEVEETAALVVMEKALLSLMALNGGVSQEDRLVVEGTLGHVVELKGRVMRKR